MAGNNYFTELPVMSPDRFNFRVTNRDGEPIRLHAIDIRTGDEWEMVHVPGTFSPYRWRQSKINKDT